MTPRFSAPSANILDAIGDTPLLMVDGIYAKIEFLNPSGSIKIRMARYMIEKAEAQGLLKPGDTIVEATSGNTGNALSLVAGLSRAAHFGVLVKGARPLEALATATVTATMATLTMSVRP